MCETSCRIRRSNDGSRKSCQEPQGAGSSRSSGTLLDQDRTPAPLSEISGFRIRDLRSPNFEIKNCYLWYPSPGLRTWWISDEISKLGDLKSLIRNPEISDRAAAMIQQRCRPSCRHSLFRISLLSNISVFGSEI